MTLYAIIEKLKMLALKHPNVNSAYEGNIYDIMNGNPQQKYASVVLTQQSHTQDDTYDHYGFNLFYVDRLISDMEDNRLQIQSTGKSMLSNIIKAFCEEFDAECDTINYQTFTERFADECAGVYCTITIDMVKDIYCTEKYWDESWVSPMITIRNQNKTVQFTENGTYIIDYDAENYTGLGKVSVEVNVPDLNGSYDDGYEDGKQDGYTEGFGIGKNEGLNEGYSQGKTDGYTEGKADGVEEGYTQGKTDGYTEGKTDGYAEGKEVGIDEQKAKLESITINENGTYTREDGYNKIVVEFEDTNGSYDEGYEDGKQDGIEEGISNAGSIIAETAQVLNITENGLYTTQYSKPEDLSTPTTGDFEGNLIRTVNVNVIPKINIQDNGMKLSYSTFTTVPECIDWDGITDMGNMFGYCRNLTTIPFIDTSKVTTMVYTFSSCANLTTIPLLDTSQVTNMQGTFSNCSNLTTIPLLDTSKVTTVNNTFSSCTNLTTIPLLDTSKVTSIAGMFNSCTSLQSLPALNVGNATTVTNIFGSKDITTLTDFGGFIGLKTSITSNCLARLPNLTYESCINVLNGLYDFTGKGTKPISTQGKLQVHANFLSLVGDEISIGTSKGWTITA